MPGPEREGLSTWSSRCIGGLRAVLRQRRGSAAMVVAVSATSVIGATALATDAGNWYLTRRNAQNAADAAALSAVRVLADSRAFGTSEAAGREIARRNGFEHGAGATVTVTNPTAVSPTIRVEISRVQPLILAGAVLRTPKTVTAFARAEALSPPQGGACGLGLGGPMTFGGNAYVGMEGCALASNNTTSNAFQFGSGGGGGSSISINAWTLVSAGGSTSFANAQQAGRVTLAGPQPAFFQRPIENPYATLAGLTPASNTFLRNLATSTTCNNMRGLPNSWDATRPFCNPGNVNSNITLPPGTYFVQGSLTVNSGGGLSGNGVNIVVLGTMNGGNWTPGNLTLRGNVDVTASATPSSTNATLNQALRGVAFYVPGASGSSQGNIQITANSGTNLTGAILAPWGTLDMRGGGASSGQPLSSSGCTVLIAYSFDMRGTSGATVENCSATGTLVPQVRIVRLIE